MADIVNDIIAENVENITEKANTTGRIPATFEGMAIAYSSLVIMAILPIFFGSFRSVSHHKEQQVRPMTRNSDLFLTQQHSNIHPNDSFLFFSLHLVHSELHLFWF